MSEKKLTKSWERKDWLQGIFENSEQKRRAAEFRNNTKLPNILSNVNGFTRGLRCVAEAFDSIYTGKRKIYSEDCEFEEWLKGAIGTSEQGRYEDALRVPYWNGFIEALRRVAKKFDIDVGEQIDIDVGEQK